MYILAIALARHPRLARLARSAPGTRNHPEASPMLDRRAFLQTSAVAAASFAFPTLAAPASAAARSPQLARLFDELFQEQLRLRPESATQLGLDKGPNADLRAKLTDESPAGGAAAKAETRDKLRPLLAIDPKTLSPAERVDWETVVYTRRSSAEVQ